MSSKVNNEVCYETRNCEDCGKEFLAIRRFEWQTRCNECQKAHFMSERAKKPDAGKMPATISGVKPVKPTAKIKRTRKHVSEAAQHESDEPMNARELAKFLASIREPDEIYDDIVANVIWDIDNEPEF